MQVLKARKNHVEQSLIPALPQLPAADLQSYAEKVTLLEQFLQHRRHLELTNLADLHATAKKSWESRKNELTLRIQQEQAQLDTTTANFDSANRDAKQRHGLMSWSLKNSYSDYIKLADNIRLYKRLEVATTGYSARWTDAKNRVNQVCRSEPRNGLHTEKRRLEEQLRNDRKALRDEEYQHRDFSTSEPDDILKIQLEYAALLGEPRLFKGETASAFERREPKPRYMGVVHLQRREDVTAINLLREPDELVVVVPLTGSKEREPKIDSSYAIFARFALFDKDRDDKLPWKGVREAQRLLLNLLLQNSDNAALTVRSMSIPNSVRLRTNRKPSCFDLSELVRDCDVDLDLPQEPTPAELANNGLQLRSYQRSSLRWMLDKEQEESELGLAGEIWHRLRFLDDSRTDFYFCDLTNSFALTISEYKADVQQNDASVERFSLPTAGFLASEMGLGKTCIALALIVANPPPLHRRVLPREHIGALAKKCDHKDYCPPMDVGKNQVLSNGTLIVVPMTLLSQWQAEIDRYAPNLNVMILHNEESPKIQVIATSDIVLASTFLLQQNGGNRKCKAKQCLNVIKRIHWHRLLCDEAHLSQGQQTRAVLANLNATHRFSVTGTPIGAQLSDLYGQLRFLRVAPFTRHSLWKNLIEDPYYERDEEALAALRLLLSRVVVRNSKSQTLAGGQALVALPPRTVETVLLPFGSEEEKVVYSALEARNRMYFMGLQKVSKANVLSKYVELMGMLTIVRQSCSHTTLVSLEKLHRFNYELEARKNRIEDSTSGLNTSQQGTVQLALSRARHSAKEKMRVAINRFVGGGYKELLECPVCFEIVGASDIALPPCSHPVCTTCLSSLLDSGTQTREASGKCPCCRDKMNQSEITFLRDISVAHCEQPGKTEGGGFKEEEDSKPAASMVSSVSTITSNGFEMKSEVRLCANVAEASSPRSSQSAITEADIQEALKQDRALLHTLEEKFLSNYYVSSNNLGTKVSHLLKEIQQMIAKSPESKCVVFSLHIGLLDIAGEELASRGIRYVRIDGSCKQHERADALLEFSTDSQTKAFLLSMRSGAIGLNLTSADHCFIMDISPNSALEEQVRKRN